MSFSLSKMQSGLCKGSMIFVGTPYSSIWDFGEPHIEIDDFELDVNFYVFLDNIKNLEIFLSRMYLALHIDINVTNNGNMHWSVK